MGQVTTAESANRILTGDDGQQGIDVIDEEEVEARAADPPSTRPADQRDQAYA
jgi:hypothetical protein